MNVPIPYLKCEWSTRGASAILAVPPKIPNRVADSSILKPCASCISRRIIPTPLVPAKTRAVANLLALPDPAMPRNRRLFRDGSVVVMADPEDEVEIAPGLVRLVREEAGFKARLAALGASGGLDLLTRPAIRDSYLGALEEIACRWSERLACGFLPIGKTLRRRVP